MLWMNLDKQLEKYRTKPCSNDHNSRRGRVRVYDMELIELLRKSGRIDSDHILKELGISAKDIDLTSESAN